MTWGDLIAFRLVLGHLFGRTGADESLWKIADVRLPRVVLTRGRERLEAELADLDLASTPAVADRLRGLLAGKQVHALLGSSGEATLTTVSGLDVGAMVVRAGLGFGRDGRYADDQSAAARDKVGAWALSESAHLQCVRRSESIRISVVNTYVRESDSAE